MYLDDGRSLLLAIAVPGVVSSYYYFHKKAAHGEIARNFSFAGKRDSLAQSGVSCSHSGFPKTSANPMRNVTKLTKNN